MKMISIIMPLYNPIINYLKDSVNSILNQTYDDFELVIVMDKYLKENDDIVTNYIKSLKDDKRIKLYINKNNLGFTNSLNKGLTLSKGNYIARIDSDDLCNNNRFNHQLIYLKNNKIDIVGSWCNVIDKNNKKIGELNPISDWPLLKKLSLFNIPFLHSSILYKKEIIKKAGLYNPFFEPSEDYEYYLRMFSQGYKGGNVPEYLVSIRENFFSILHSYRWRMNRIKTYQSKQIAISKYKFNSPMDYIFLITTPIILLIDPKLGFYMKKLSNKIIKRLN